MNSNASIRILVAQLLILASILSIVCGLGFFPSSDQPLLESRVELCETLAIATSRELQNPPSEALRDMLNQIVNRNAGLASIGLRDSRNRYVEQVGDHDQRWQPALGSDPRCQLQTPLWDGQRVWGSSK